MQLQQRGREATLGHHHPEVSSALPDLMLQAFSGIPTSKTEAQLYLLLVASKGLH